VDYFLQASAPSLDIPKNGEDSCVFVKQASVKDNKKPATH
jgi:hypothetical protein